MKPHECPVCDGMGEREKPPIPADNIFEYLHKNKEWLGKAKPIVQCSACKGSGIVWRPNSMKIEIKLDDHRYCTGCPCLNIPYRSSTTLCSIGHFEEGKNNSSSVCRNGKLVFLRPQACIDQHGE